MKHETKWRNDCVHEHHEPKPEHATNRLSLVEVAKAGNDTQNEGGEWTPGDFMLQPEGSG
jgi:hypothetical protein